MNKQVRQSRIAGFFNLLGSAVAASAAVERRAKPEARDLRILGVDPEQFGRIAR